MDMSVRALEEAIPIRRQIDSLEKRLSLSLSLCVCVCAILTGSPARPCNRPSAKARSSVMLKWEP